TWQDAVEFYNYGDILIVFGEQSDTHIKSLGTVKPFCGELIVPTTDLTQVGPVDIQEMYYAMVMTMWEDPRLDELGRKAAAMYGISNPGVGPCDINVSVGDVGPCANGRSNELPDSTFGQTLNSAYFLTAGAIIDIGRDAMITNLDFTVSDQMRAYGWGGAGIWYNQIAEWNGSLFSAAINIPTPKTMPIVMKEVESQKAGTDQNAPVCERYSPYIAAKDRAGDMKLDAKQLPIAEMLEEIYKYWRCQNPTERTENKASGNVIFDTLGAIFGLQGLFTLRENATTHPMAQLSGIGRSIVESAVRNLMTALGFSFMGGMAEILDQNSGGAFFMISSIFISLSTLGLSIGFILYYVMPFLPFMYFFFAVGAWVKSVFEAMVGVPLWALAHLRIHGNGLHGDTALNGYFLIFEIFIRPILTVFGLLAGMVIFSAMVRTLNGIFPMVTANLTGFDADSPKVAGKILGIEFKRAVVDEFFFTVIYTVIVYMIGMSSFKLIDQVPNNIMRWMGNNAASFAAQEQIESSMSTFVNYAAISGAGLTGQAARAASAGARLGGNIAGAPFGLMGRLGGGRDAQVRGAPGGGSGGGGAGGGSGSGGGGSGGAGD
ncbi:MAG TPA: DotA/TraY family protein, partial [Micavibrio sp.]